MKARRLRATDPTCEECLKQHKHMAACCDACGKIICPNCMEDHYGGSHAEEGLYGEVFRCNGVVNTAADAHGKAKLEDSNG